MPTDGVGNEPGVVEPGTGEPGGNAGVSTPEGNGLVPYLQTFEMSEPEPQVFSMGG